MPTGLDRPSFIPTHERIAALDRLGDEIAELAAHLEAATARLLELIREFDARGGWNTGFRSCAEWLSSRIGLEPGAAREHVRVARALGSLPLLSQALAGGELSYRVGRAGTAEHVERIVRGWRRIDQHVEAQEARHRHRSRSLYLIPGDDGMFILKGRLEPEVGALLIQALAAARETLYQRRRAATPAVGVQDETVEAPSMVQQQADALGLLAEVALHQGLDPGSPAERYQVVVHVDAPVLADASQPGQSVLEEGGQHVPAGTSQRLACDATRVVMRHDADGRVTEVGARTRTIPPALRRALQQRDHGCRFPGCGGRHTQGHHIHHRAVHEEGYHVERSEDGTLRFRRPDGHAIPNLPPPAPVPADPVGALREWSEREGLRLDARTTCPEWDGARLDLGYALDVLHPMAQPGGRC